MAQTTVIMPAEARGELPVVRTIGLADLKDALRRGFRDFMAIPTYAIFLCLIYPVVGLALGWAVVGYDIIHLLYPLAAGFALLGPFAAIGLYELSRRREMGLDTSWKHAFDIVHSPSLWSILGLGGLLVAIFGVWLFTAQMIYAAHFGLGEQPLTLNAFMRQLSTPAGRSLILVGNLVGFLFAALAYAISVVSFPLLLDRNVGVATAIVTSINVILKNPLTMIAWGLIVAAGIAFGFLTFLIGLAVVVPILGHATWHLYRKAVEPDRSPRPEYHPRERETRYAAEFPVALFMPVSRRKE